MLDSIDICAEIVPGKGAAGFHLGGTIQKIKSTIHKLDEWEGSSKLSLYEAISATSEWLSYVRENGCEVLYFGRGIVELHFNDKGVLFNIFVSEGYSGTLWGEIKIGSALSIVQKQCSLEYDEGDEMHYPSEECSLTGVAFYAEELPLEEAPNQVIKGISVHNWSIGA